MCLEPQRGELRAQDAPDVTAAKAPARQVRLPSGVVAGLCLGLALAGWVGPCLAAESGNAVRYAERMPLADESLVLDAVPAAFGAVAVGERGHVLLSDDFIEWRQAESVPTRATLTAVTFIGREGWAVGHDTVILRTADAGETWERRNFEPEREQPLMDVLFLDRERGYAVGAYDLFLETTDGGGTWTDRGGVDALDDWHLNDILRTENGTFFIAAEQGLVYRSTDDAASWETLELPYQGSMFGILETRPNEVLVFGLRGRAFRTEDGGETWTPVDTGTDSSLFGGNRLADGSIVLVGNNGTITSRPPNGEFRARQHGEGEPLAGLIESPEGTLVYFGVNGIGTGAASREAR